MKGWAIVPWKEDSESSTPAQNILPPGKKRARSQTRRLLDNEMERWQTAKKKATGPSRPSSEDKQEQIQPMRIRVGGRLRSKEYNQLEREINRLKMQNNLLVVAESREIQRLKDEVKRLESLKAEQNKKIDRLIPSTVGLASSDTVIDEPEIIRMKDKEIEQQNATIKDLQSSLSSALKSNTLLSAIRDEELPTAIANFAHEMKGIELGVLRTAELFSSCLYPLSKLTSPIQIHPDLGDMIRKAIRSVKVLSSMPGLALRALLFHVIRDQIIYSEVWTALHVEGYMLRGYQKAIQQSGESQFNSKGICYRSNTSNTSATREIFEKFHRVALLHMLEYDSEFRTCFLEAHAEELQTHIMALLDPLLNPVELETKEKDIHRELRGLLSRAYYFRAQCFPTDGIRYEVIQFKPGERFDPAMMEAQDAAGNPVSVPTGSTKYSIKLCVHGLIVAHTIQESSSGLQKIKELSQPFQTSETKKGRSIKTGEIISGKAIVILQD
jgi:hypothetical protein